MAGRVVNMVYVIPCSYWKPVGWPLVGVHYWWVPGPLKGPAGEVALQRGAQDWRWVPGLHSRHGLGSPWCDQQEETCGGGVGASPFPPAVPTEALQVHRRWEEHEHVSTLSCEMSCINKVDWMFINDRWWFSSLLIIILLSGRNLVSLYFNILMFTTNERFVILNLNLFSFLLF